jgi:hypothetical protein
LVNAPPWSEVAGCRVLVAGAREVEDAARAIALHAPSAVLVVPADAVDRALEVSLLPRGRVLGTGDPEAVATAVAFDTQAEMAVTLGGSAEPRTVRVGAGGAR